MAIITRRALLQAISAGAFTKSYVSGARPAPTAPAPSGSPVLGKLKPRSSLSVQSSRLSIGFETLDRRMFEPEKTYPHLADLGVKWARAQTGWARCEQKPGVYDFAWLDSVVDSLRRIGIQPWFNLGYGNRLYTPDAPHESAVGWAPLFSDKARAAWLAFVRRISDHFRDRVTHWEIWNEPNISGFWQPKKPNPSDYVELVKMTAPEIRKRVRNAVIIGGALAGLRSALGFLEKCMDAGLADYVDKVSYHPYRAIPEAGYEAEVRDLRTVLARYKAGMGIWQGECGCPSEKGGSGALANLDWNELRQAKWLLRRILSDLRLDVELVAYFHTVDMVNYVTATGPSAKTNFKGILRGTDYTPKPSYYAYQNLCALFDAQTTPMKSDVKLSVLERAPVAGAAQTIKEEAICSATFQRRGVPLCVYWYPADLMKDFTVGLVQLAWSGKDVALSRPVWVDTLTGRIYRLDLPQKKAGAWLFDTTHLEDYPIIITDQAAIDASGA
ncbi:beta-galactosidase [Candidatus Sumerlaeota bacterium]|nr:beta-galactosidase [Candidatus Sumerlaeota bacterium]